MGKEKKPKTEKETKKPEAQDHRQEKIHHRPGQRHQDVVQLGIAQVVGIDRHRFSPTDQEPAGRDENHEQRKNDGPDQVNMD